MECVLAEVAVAAWNPISTRTLLNGVRQAEGMIKAEEERGTQSKMLVVCSGVFPWGTVGRLSMHWTTACFEKYRGGDPV